MDMRELAARLAGAGYPPIQIVAINDTAPRYKYGDIPPNDCAAVIFQNNRGLLIVRVKTHRVAKTPPTFTGEYYAYARASDAFAFLKKASGGKVRIPKSDLNNVPQCVAIGFDPDGEQSNHVRSDVRVTWPDVPH